MRCVVREEIGTAIPPHPLRWTGRRGREASGDRSALRLEQTARVVSSVRVADTGLRNALPPSGLPDVKRNVYVRYVVGSDGDYFGSAERTTRCPTWFTPGAPAPESPGVNIQCPPRNFQ